MTTQVEWISHEAEELLQLAEWDAHLACDFRCARGCVAHVEDRTRHKRISKSSST